MDIICLQGLRRRRGTLLFQAVPSERRKLPKLQRYRLSTTSSSARRPGDWSLNPRSPTTSYVSRVYLRIVCFTFLFFSILNVYFFLIFKKDPNFLFRISGVEE